MNEKDRLASLLAVWIIGGFLACPIRSFLRALNEIAAKDSKQNADSTRNFQFLKHSQHIQQ